MARRLIALAFILASANAAIAADDMKMPINSGDLKWGPAPPALPKGAEFTVLSGDPSKDGPYGIPSENAERLSIPAHNHPTTENVTVISGNFHIGMGDKLDEKKGIELTAGGYGEAQAKINHFAWTTSASVVQVHGQGPFPMTYVIQPTTQVSNSEKGEPSNHDAQVKAALNDITHPQGRRRGMAPNAGPFSKMPVRKYGAPWRRSRTKILTDVDRPGDCRRGLTDPFRSRRRSRPGGRCRDRRRRSALDADLIHDPRDLRRPPLADAARRLAASFVQRGCDGSQRG